MTPIVTAPQTPDGWKLELRRYVDEPSLDPDRPPILFVPGYGMNTFVLAFHPSGQSMVEHLVWAGFDVWTVNLRGQGGAERVGGPKRIGFRELALIDVPRAIEAVLAERPDHDRVTLAGCSLGASIAYAYLAHHPRDHRLGAMIALGGPLRWRGVHPLVELAFSSPRLIGSVPFVGTRALARLGLAVFEHAPALLSLYMNAEKIDLSRAGELVQTVDDPIPFLNRQIAHWVRERDLRVADVNVTEALAEVEDLSLLCVLANRDGVVPPEAALSVLDVLEADPADVLLAGGSGEDDWFAHADLFISERARQEVFEPMTDWLLTHT